MSAFPPFLSMHIVMLDFLTDEIYFKGLVTVHIVTVMLLMTPSMMPVYLHERIMMLHALAHLYDCLAIT
jgi:hypothetical protein